MRRAEQNRADVWHVRAGWLSARVCCAWNVIVGIGFGGQRQLRIKRKRECERQCERELEYQR